jgi:hypothetical protein
MVNRGKRIDAIDWEAISFVENYGFGNVKKMLNDMYLRKELSASEIAQKAGCFTGTVLHKLKSLGIPIREPYKQNAKTRQKRWNMVFASLEECLAKYGRGAKSLRYCLQRNGYQTKWYARLITFLKANGLRNAGTQRKPNWIVDGK